MSELMRRGAALGLPFDALADAQDAEDPKAALVSPSISTAIP